MHSEIAAGNYYALDSYQKKYYGFIASLSHEKGVDLKVYDENTIFINSYPGEIEINDHQDEELKQYYRKGKLRLDITERIHSESGKVERATLDGFSPLTEERSIYLVIHHLREEYGACFSGFDQSYSCISPI